MIARPPAEANVLLTDPTVDFKSTPFFGWFDDRAICTNAFLAESAVSRDLQSQLLADVIPVESLPAGADEVPSWNPMLSILPTGTERNVNMAALYKEKKIAILLLVTIIDSVAPAERVTVDYFIDDDHGIPVKGARVRTSTEKKSIIQSWYSSAKYAVYIEKTDDKGKARCTFNCHNGDFNVLVEAEGHYPVQMFGLSFRTDYDFATKSVKFFEKEKRLNITLFRKINPIPMNSYYGDMRWTQFWTNAYNRCGYDLQLQIGCHQKVVVRLRIYMC